MLPRDAIITTDVGWNKNGVGQQFPIYTPGTVLTPGGFATMGFGAPAAIGAKIARPDRVVVSLVGDGGFGQNPAMLATAVEQDVAVVWVVMNNNAFGTIAGLQKAALRHHVRHACSATAATRCTRDYAAIAEAYGVDGIKVESAAEFRPALEQAIALEQPGRDRRGDEERADADRRATGTSWTSTRPARPCSTSRRTEPVIRLTDS